MADLTTLANVKGWLGISNVDAARDTTLERLLRAQSRYIEAWLSRVIISQTYREVRDGSGMGAGRYALAFANDPVSSVISVTINNLPVPISADGAIQTAGYSFDSNALWLAPTAYNNSPTGFTRGRRNVVLKYIGGFLVLPLNQFSDNDWLLPAEQQTIPAAPFIITPNLTWLSDNGVQFVAGGASLVAVASSPAAGQYSVGTLNGVPGVYTFNAADANKVVALSYSYVPSDIEQACIELVALRWKERDRIGLVSQAVGTESTSFYTQKDMPAQVATDLQQYKRVFSL